VLAKEDLGQAGARRLRLVAIKNQPASAFTCKVDDGGYAEHVVLDFDYWAAIPKR
jgi:2-methylfumaryl-CoA hydratase